MFVKIPIAALVIASALAASPPTFDTASIRPSAPGGRGMDPGEFLRDGPQLSPVSFTLRNATLKLCIRWAWNVMESQVSGPGWMGIQRFDIIGKSAAPATDAEFRLMLQALLTERFHLEFHRETKEQSAYLLTVGKNGPKFKESKSDAEPGIEPNQAQMSIAVKGAKISSLADLLSKLFFMPVVDQTGLTGRYDVAINVGKYLPDKSDGVPDIPGIISAGLQEELGLKLELKKVPLDLLIVDRADRNPSEN